MLENRSTDVLLLGARGMLGHRLWIELSGREGVVGTIRPGSPDPGRVVTTATTARLVNLDATDEEATESLLNALAPRQIINAIGYVKQRHDAEQSVVRRINTEFPQQLGRWCHANSARLVHLSTDCVFSGTVGNRKESDAADPVDDYGRTKLAGEPDPTASLTLRTSMIGHELSRFSGILEWCLRANPPLNGWSNARFSGLSTIELTRVIVDIVDNRPELLGLVHVAGPTIDKASLLRSILHAYGRPSEVHAVPVPVIDRTLDGGLFASSTGYRPPTWTEMLAELAADSVRYVD